MNLSVCRLAVLGAFVISAAPVGSQEFHPEVQAAIDAVRKHVTALPNGFGSGGDYSPQGAPAVKNAFPGHRFVIVRFRIYPVAKIIPEGLRPANVFALDKAGRLEHLKDVKTMEAFFRANHRAAQTDADAKAALAAWLTLSPEFHQDNMFQFEVLDKEFAGDKSKVAGRAIVKQGGNGELRAELVFDAQGKLASATEKAAIRAGPRPICQATKLLDPDPIVRRMAEADLLIMGLAARDYLMEQRNLAAPDLRDAIDRLWRTIEKNGP